MGAQIGRPDRRVFNIAGDGSFRMNLNELATAQFYNIPIIQVVMNNQTLGMVRQWQTLFYHHRYSQTTLDRGPDFDKLGEAFGIPTFHISRPEQVDDAIQKALAIQGPSMIMTRYSRWWRPELRSKMSCCRKNKELLFSDRHGIIEVA